MTVSTKILRSTTDFNVDDNFILLLFWAYIYKKKNSIPKLLKGSVNSIEYKSSYIYYSVYITNIFIIVFSFHRNAIIIQSQCLFICSQWV